MPYISIKSFPKDRATQEKTVERLNEVFLELWGCPPQTMTISVETVEPTEWEERVVKPEIEPNMDKMFILSGEKRY